MSCDTEGVPFRATRMALGLTGTSAIITATGVGVAGVGALGGASVAGIGILGGAFGLLMVPFGVVEDAVMGLLNATGMTSTKTTSSPPPQKLVALPEEDSDDE